MFGTIVLAILQQYGGDILRELAESLTPALAQKIAGLWSAGQPLTREEIDAIRDEYPLQKFEYDDVDE